LSLFVGKFLYEGNEVAGLDSAVLEGLLSLNRSCAVRGGISYKVVFSSLVELLLSRITSCGICELLDIDLRNGKGGLQTRGEGV